MIAYDKIPDEIMKNLEEVNFIRSQRKKGEGVSLLAYETKWEAIAMLCDNLSEADVQSLWGLLLATGDMVPEDIDLIKGINDAWYYRRGSITIHRTLRGEYNTDPEKIQEYERDYRRARRELCKVSIGMKGDAQSA